VSARLGIGIDVGGTTTRVGVVTAEGELEAEVQAPSAEVTATQDVDRLAAMIGEARAAVGGRYLGAVGVGVTGQIDPSRGVIDNPFTLPGWHDFALGEALSERFSVPVAIENDVDAAALGEHWRGAGRGEPRLFVMTVGTGIGTGFIVDGELYRGARGLHPEAGHQIVDPSGPLCFCGARGCLEVLASGAAIERMAAERWVSSTYGRPDGRAIAAAARRGDEAAAEIFRQVSRYLGLGLINVVTVLAPTKILLGGGVLEAWEVFAETLHDSLRQTDTLLPGSGVEVAPCALGQRAGIIGAAYCAHRRLEEGS
jgi:glucokinase